MAWITVDDVAAALGPQQDADDAYLAQCTAAANVFAFRRRAKAGYKDLADSSPGPDASLGTVTYAVALFRERGSVDSYSSFDEFAGGALPSSTFGQVLRLLGVPRPQVDRLDDDDLAYRRRHGVR